MKINHEAFLRHPQSGVPLIYRRKTPGCVTGIRNRRLYLYSQTRDLDWEPNATIPDVTFREGQLFVGGHQILEPQIRKDHVTWHQFANTEQGPYYTEGLLHLNANGLEAHGHVTVGSHPDDTITYDVIATVIPSVMYTSRITSEKHAKSTKPASIPPQGWENGLSLEISYKTSLGSTGIPSPLVHLNGEELSEESFFFTVDGDDTVLHLSLDDETCAFDTSLYQNAELRFNQLSLNAPGIGFVAKKCGQTGSEEKKADSVWLWHAAVSSVEGEYLAKRQDSQLQTIQPSQLMQIPSETLSIGLLMQQLPDETVSDASNSMLMRNMKWSMGQKDEERKWLSQFLDERPPVITEKDQVKLVNSSLPWYQDKFAMAYLTQSFNSYDGPNAPSNRLNTKQATKLSTYLKTGLAKSADFNMQNTGIFVDAFRETKTPVWGYLKDTAAEYAGWAQGSIVLTRKDTKGTLTVPIGLAVKTSSGVIFTTQSQYIFKDGVANSEEIPVAAQATGVAGIVSANSITEFAHKNKTGLQTVSNPSATTLSKDTGGLKWAKKLFTSLTTGSQFVLMVNRVAGASGDPKALGPVNNFACLLTVLEPTGALARDYFNAIMSGVIVKQLPKVRYKNKDDIMQWLPTTLQLLFEKMADGELPDIPGISKTEATEIYQEYLKHGIEINGAIADLLLSIQSSNFINRARQAEAGFENTIAAKWPKMAKAAKMMMAVGWIGAVASVIVSISRGDWSKMSDVEKGEFVTNCVQLGVAGFDAVPLILQGVKYVSLKAWNFFLSFCHKCSGEITDVRAQVANETTDLLPQQENAVMQDAVEANTLGKGTMFERIFAEGVFSGVLKVVGAMAAVAMVGLSAWQLAKDLKKGASVSTKVFDSLILAANAIAAICLIADLFVATSFLPIVGAVAAIVGLVIGILAGYFEKPANPIDKWLSDHGIPFVDGLEAQDTPTPSLAQI